MDEQSLPPVRFRAIIEMTFPGADRLDYDLPRLIEEWRKALEEDPRFNCKDVRIRECMYIGGSDADYDEWRNQVASDFPQGPPRIRIFDPDSEKR